MPKFAKNMYTTAKGERKLNCYNISIPKEVVELAKLVNVELKITAIGEKIIIEKKN